MSSAAVNYPGAVANLSAVPEVSPGVWLNIATIALAESGAAVEDLRAFRQQVISGGVDSLVATIARWMQVV